MPRFIRRHLEEPVPVAAIDHLMDLRAAGNQILPTLTDPDASPLSTLTAGLDDLATSAPLSGVPTATAAVRSTLPEVEDGRQFHPDLLTRPSKTVRGSSSRIKAARPSRAANSQTLNSVQFQRSASVIICIRRFARRAAILASGRGGGRHRDPVWKETSNIWCNDVSNARRL